MQANFLYKLTNAQKAARVLAVHKIDIIAIGIKDDVKIQIAPNDTYQHGELLDGCILIVKATR